MTVGESPPPAPAKSFALLLARPAEQRVREFKYRFAQSIVFGLPVIALQRYGRSLGWVEADRWVGVLQLLLAGWVMYVGVAGMLFEGLVTIRRRVTLDFCVAVVAAGFYLFSAGSLVRLVIGGTARHRTMFDVAVAIAIAWSGARWFQLSRSARHE
jgi:hypothetical protein